MPVECYLQYLLKTICTINFAIYKYIWKYTYHCNHKQTQNDKTKDTNYTTKGTNVLGLLLTRVLKLSALSIPPDYHLVIYLSRSRCKSKQGQGANANPKQGQGTTAKQGQGANARQDQGASTKQGQGANAKQGQGASTKQGQGANTNYSQHMSTQNIKRSG